MLFLFTVKYKTWNTDFSGLCSHSILSVGENAEFAIELAKSKLDSDCRDFEATKIETVFSFSILVKEKSCEVDTRNKAPHRQGVCPVCGSDTLSYGSSGVVETSYYYDWTCQNCKASGKEWYDLVFSEHRVDSETDKMLLNNTLELVRENIKVELENIGEGICGDYDENNPDDVNLLRFYVYERCNRDNEWSAVEDASYCTNIPADTDRKILIKALSIIMDRVFYAVKDGSSVKKICEELSWLSDTTLKKEDETI